MNELVYWIWLSLACSVDTATFRDLMKVFDTAEDVYNATDKQIRTAVNPKISDCSALYVKKLDRANEIYEYCREKNIGILTYNDARFPLSLKMIKTPPVLLYYRGVLPDFNNIFPCAVVGARNLSSYGRKNAFNFGYDLGSVGGTVVSGMAMGVDGVALAGAIAAGAPTIVFLGNGIDICYPEGHKTLARSIVKKGCIMTEYPPSTPPNRYNFPKRNRLISGVSIATVVVEGGERSGSLITARYAKSQNKPVYAFPGNVGNEGSRASHILIKEGAHLCTSAEDVIRDFEFRSNSPLDLQRLSKRTPVDMVEVLSSLSVLCVTVDDEIFTSPTKKGRKKTKSQSRGDELPPTSKLTEDFPDFENGIRSENKSVKNKGVPENKPLMPQLSEDLLHIYKMIPVDSDCYVESLVCEGYDLMRVMTILLKLEVLGFVYMLPGDRVKRNLR